MLDEDLIIDEDNLWNCPNCRAVTMLRNVGRLYQ